MKKKILHIVEAFGGGIFSFLVDLINNTSDEYEIVVAYAMREQTPENFKEKFSENVKFIRVENFVRSISIKKDIQAFGEIKKIIKEEKPQIIHLHSSKAGFLGRMATIGIDGNYLYNRCHLIGYQLSGENANIKNLITGTRYMNNEGMLPFENMVADYIKENDNHVLYRVTPIFEGDNLLASGVLIEAKSVEDNGDGIEFCVYCYNVQPGITINYANGESDGPEFKGSETNKTSTTTVPATTTTQTTKKEQTSTSTPSASTQTTTKPATTTKPSTTSKPAATQPAPAMPAPAPAPTVNSEMVWIPRTGKKFHNNPGCSNMSNPSQVTRSQAEASGFTACKKCY